MVEFLYTGRCQVEVGMLSEVVAPWLRFRGLEYSVSLLLNSSQPPWVLEGTGFRAWGMGFLNGVPEEGGSMYFF